MARFQVPEVSEQVLSVRGVLTLEDTAGVPLIDDVRVDVPQRGEGWDSGRAEVSLPSAFEKRSALDLSMTIFPKMEIGLSQHAGGRLNRVALKYQFHGVSRELSKLGNLSFALATTYGFDEGLESSRYSRIANSGPVYVHWDANYASRTLDLGLIAGYRANPIILLFGGPFASRNKFVTTFHRNDEVSGAQTLYQSNTLWVNGINAGAEVSLGKKRRFIFAVEANMQWMSWDRIGFADRTGTLGALVGFQF